MRLAADGAKAVVAEIDESSGRSAAREISERLGGRARFVRTDVSDRGEVVAAVPAALDAWGRLDILVNNAWDSADAGGAEEKTDAQLSRAFAVGFHGPLWAMQTAFASMRARGWGRVVNMCSLSGVDAHRGTSEYNAAKEALRTLTRTAAREWAATGVVVNAVCPAAHSAAFRRAASARPHTAREAEAAAPMRRLGDPEDGVAPVVAFLADEGCRYLTGNTLLVDGGAHLNGVAWGPEPEGPG